MHQRSGRISRPRASGFEVRLRMIMHCCEETKMNAADSQSGPQLCVSYIEGSLNHPGLGLFASQLDSPLAERCPPHLSVGMAQRP
jgi:hypothetical protein